MKEEQLQLAVCDYIRLRYPDVLFNSDMSGIKLTMGQAIKAKRMRSSRGFPDLVIYANRKGRHGLFLELKAEGTKLTKKDGSFKSEHIEEQAEMLVKLWRLGFKADFAIGFEDAKQQIDDYLKEV